MSDAAFHPALAPFTPQVRDWFTRAFATPTPAQVQAWPAIAGGQHALISAPTGSGKTLAAFLWALDRFVAEPSPPDPRERSLRLVYISPLKALGYDVERNLRAPLRGIGADVRVAVRTGDTPQRERRDMLRHAPDVLITTPESLYLMLTSQARELFNDVQWVIVDEIHAVAQTKRGAHLAVTLERLAVQAGRDVQRIGLSATQRPLDEVGRFLVGPQRPCTVVDAGVRKPLDLRIHVPVESMVEPDAPLDLPSVEGGEATRRSIWPAIYPELLRLVREHRSTLVFVNNRRAAERIALRLNHLAAQEDEERGAPVREIARAHHGSLAREERVVIEDLLKSGKLPCLVATSSLELGIDMGALDLVVQVESPKSVTRGLQRIGRAGHGVGEVSRGRIFPKFRADLLECAVVARRMREGLIEATVVPRNPLDVLAQQVVAMAAGAGEEGLAVDELHALLRRTWTYAELERRQLENVLDMLDGRYPSTEFGELRARIVWDRLAGTIRARDGARALAVANAGTIPDRGLFSVNLPDGRRVGELDEEMVYEARAGQTFLLGATSWRIEQITRDRVIVTPAPGVPGAVPFWHGDGVGRPKELGEAIGAFSREALLRDEASLQADFDLDERAARNLLAYLREQQEATGVVPSDRTVVVERFRDEIGDWRLCLLTPFGGRVHAAWALALSARIRDAFGLESDAIWSDDGIIVHLPDADEPPGAELVLVAARRGGGPRGGGTGRERAVRRALSRERGARPAHTARLPGAAHAAVAAAPEGAIAAGGGAALPAVPHRAGDVPRVPARRARPARAHRRAAPPAHARAVAGRGGDADGLAVRLLAAVRLRGHLHVRGRCARPPSAVPWPWPWTVTCCASCWARRSCATSSTRPRWSRWRTTCSSVRRTCGRAAPTVSTTCCAAWATSPPTRRRSAVSRRPEAAAWLDELERAAPRRTRPRRRPGALARGRGRRPVPRCPGRGAARRPARGLPGGRAGRAAASLCAATRAATAPSRPVRCAPATVWTRSRRSPPWSAPASWCAASCVPPARSASGATPRCCAVCAGPRWPPCARKSSRWPRPRWRASRRPGRAWTATRRPAPASPACATPWRRCRAWPCRPSCGSSDVLPRRLGAYSPAWLDELCAGGELVWVGAGPVGARSGRVALYFRDDAPLLGPPPGAARAAARARARARARAPGARRLLLRRPARGERRCRRRGAARGLVGPCVGRRGHQRRLRAAARPQGGGARGAGPCRRAAAGRRTPLVGPALQPARARRAAAAGPLVAHRRRVRCR